MGWLELTEECRAAVERWDGGYGPPTRENRPRQGIQVFRALWVERWLATSHPALPGVWFGGFIAWGLVVGFVDPQVGPLPGIGLYALGLLAWTLLEYVLHRVVFHLAPGRRFASKVRQFLAHGYHHQFPNDRWRLVAPPLMSWPIALGVWGAYRLLLGPSLVWAAFGGTCAGYLAYDWLHYATHHVTPRTALGKFLRRHHLIHHFGDPSSNHGISSPLWDLVLGTLQTRGGSARRPSE